MNETPWLAWVARLPFANPGTPGRSEQEHLLDESGYPDWKGWTFHKTREEAEAATRNVLEKVIALDGAISWVGGWLYLSLSDPEGQGAHGWVLYQGRPKTSA